MALTPTVSPDVAMVSDAPLPSVFCGASAIVLGVCGPILFLTLPFFLTLVKLDRGFDPSQVSLISSADMVGMFLANAMATYWIRAANWRLVAATSLVVMIAATVWSLVAISFPMFGLSRVVAGIGAGSLMGLGLTAMGERRQADAWFGWFVGIQAIVGAITAWGIPRFIMPFGLGGFLKSLIVLYVLLLPFALFIPRRAIQMARHNQRYSAVKPTSIELAAFSLVAAFTFYMGIFAIWSHIDLIGRAAGIDAKTIGDAVSLGYLIGIPASVATIILAGKIRRLCIFIIIGLIQLTALALLWHFNGLFGFRLATLLLGWLWYFAAPPQMAITVALDPTGRFIVLFVAAMKSSYAVAGVLLAIVMSGSGTFERVVLLSGLCTIISMTMYGILAIKSDRPLKS